MVVMTALELALTLAHAGHTHDANLAPLAAIIVAAMVVPLIALALIGRAFYRASKRDAERGPGGPP